MTLELLALASTFDLRFADGRTRRDMGGFVRRFRPDIIQFRLGCDVSSPGEHSCGQDPVVALS